MFLLAQIPNPGTGLSADSIPSVDSPPLLQNLCTRWEFCSKLPTGQFMGVLLSFDRVFTQLFTNIILTGSKGLYY